MMTENDLNQNYSPECLAMYVNSETTNSFRSKEQNRTLIKFYNAQKILYTKLMILL